MFFSAVGFKKWIPSFDSYVQVCCMFSFWRHLEPLHPTVGSTKVNPSHFRLVSKVTSCSLEDGCTAILRITGCLPIVPCISPDPRQPKTPLKSWCGGMMCFFLVHKQNGNSQIQVSWSNSYCKKHSCRMSFYLFVWCVLVDSFFFRDLASPHGAPPKFRLKMRNHKWAFQYFMIGEGEWNLEASPFHSPTPGHMHLGQGFWYLPVQLHRWISMGNDVELGMWEKTLIRCMDGSVLCILDIWRTKELGISQIYEQMGS